MRVVKLGVISVIVLFIILFLMSLLIPSNVRISRAINIEAPPGDVFPYVADIRKWNEWNEMLNDRIDVQLLSADSNLVTSKWTYGGRSIYGFCRLEKAGEITIVQWYFDFRLKWYPWEKFGSITFEKQFGPPMERSLTNLRKRVTKTP